MKQYLSFGEVFKESARIFRLHFGKILLLILLAVVPVGLVYGVLDGILMNNSEMAEIMAIVEESNEDPAASSKLIDRVNVIMPYSGLLAVLSLLLNVFPVAVARLALDESSHGALSPNYRAGDLYVNVIDPDSFRDVGSAGYYFSTALRLMPKVLFCFLCGAFIALFGFMLMIVPGIIAMLVTSVSVVYVALTGRTGFKGFLYTGILLLKRPVIIFVYLLSSGASLLLNFNLDLVYSLMPQMNEAAGIVFSAVFTTVAISLSSLITAFATILATCFTANTLDVIGLKINENGFYEEAE